ncbi:serine hydrolase [Pollutibacter soli]|uniref:serine hydrolase n=1 Tax=Pollutibacter soli TaxID=3034157 RepID=UPI0030137DE6
MRFCFGFAAVFISLFLVTSCNSDKKVATSTTQLEEQIREKMKAFPEAKYAVAFRNLSNGEELMINAEDSFHAASTMKTPVMIELYKRAAEGNYSMDSTIVIKNNFKSIVDGSEYRLDSMQDSEHDLYLHVGEKMKVKDLIFRMITMSSNLATNILIEEADPKNIISTMRSIGADQIQVRRGVEDSKAFELGLNNRTNAKDLMTIFTHLANGTIVNKTTCDSMIVTLMQQHFTDRIPGKLPKDVKTATKSGSITKVCHDSGIVFLPDGKKYVVVILTSGIANEEKASALIADVSLAIYNYVTR